MDIEGVDRWDKKHSEDSMTDDASHGRPPLAWIILSFCILILVALIMVAAWMSMPEPEERRDVSHTYQYDLRITNEGNGTLLVPYLDMVPFTYDSSNGSYPGYELVDSIHGGALNINLSTCHGMSRSMSTKKWYSDWAEFTMEGNLSQVWIFYDPEEPQGSNTSISLTIQHSSDAPHSGTRIYEIRGQLMEGWAEYPVRDRSIAA